MKRSGPKRCNYYNNRGDLRDPNQPCKKGPKCFFTHPSHAEWDIAELSQPPSFWNLPKTPPSPPRRLPPTRYPSNRRHSPSPSRSAPRGRSPARPTHSRRDRDISMSSERSEPPGPRTPPPLERKPSGFPPQSTSPTLRRSSISTLTTNERRNVSTSSTSNAVRMPSEGSTSIMKRPSTETTFKPPSAKAPPKVVPPSISKVPPSPFQDSAAAAFVPPSPTAPSAALPPPPRPAPSVPPPTSTPAPPPALPSLSIDTAKPSDSKPETLHGEKQKVWDQRVATLAKYYKHKTEHRKLAERVSAVERIFDSSRMRGVPEKKIRDLEKLKRRFDEEKILMDGAMSQLVDSDSWPVGGGPRSEAEELKSKKDAEDMQNLIERAQQLGLNLKKLYGLVTDEGKEKETDKGKGKEKETVDPDGDVKMTAEQEEGPSSRPLKRRRTLSATEDNRVAIDGPTMEELEEFEAKVGYMEDTLSNLENVHNAQKSEMFDELTSMLDPSNLGYKDVLSPETATMQTTVDTMDSELREVADETARLLNASHDTVREIARLNQESFTLHQDIITLTDQMKEYEKQRLTDHDTIEALTTALQMYNEHPPSPPASPFQREHILPMIEEPVTQAVRVAVQERGNELRAELEKTLETSHELLYQTVWDKLITTGRTVQVVMSRLQDPNQAGPPA
ncbi:hypothetical protein L218DRAFT_899596 [Marasmius fiardii PR-910]|nr:hypothetical protein L218DRAFT_899596 [Marasmius fiardii PR-910]